MRFNFLLLASLLIIVSCKSQFNFIPEDESKIYNPPGTIKIGDNLFYDQAEMTNQNWREYIYWTKRNYGHKSQLYLESLPDTTVWESFTRYKDIYRVDYFDHPAFNYYPLVGISFSQVEKYTQWRTNRVIESLLINNGLLEIQEKRDSTQCFSADEYFSSLEWNNGLRKILIPVYSIPTLEEYESAVKYNNSTICKKKYKFEESKSAHFWELHTVTIDDYSSAHAYKSCPKNCKCIHFLQSNVNEYLKDTIMGNLPEAFDSLTIISSSDPSINAWTGFRNVCKWMTIEEFLNR